MKRSNQMDQERTWISVDGECVFKDSETGEEFVSSPSAQIATPLAIILFLMVSMMVSMFTGLKSVQMTDDDYASALKSAGIVATLE